MRPVGPARRARSSTSLPTPFAGRPWAAGHSAWLSWILSGGLQEFYQDLRWDGWRDEVSVLNGRQGLSFFPPLWSAEARQDLSATSRRVVPMAELLSLSRTSCLQFDWADPGFLGASDTEPL